MLRDTEEMERQEYGKEGNEGRKSEIKMPYVIFKLQDSKYAISSKYVLHIEVMREITPMVGGDAYCLGIIIFNEESVPVFDLRQMFGFSNYAEELNRFMQDRIADHERWVDALEESVENEKEFTLTTDPHQCAFGKWYDAFQTDNSYLELFLKEVDAPHKEIHATGVKVKQLMAQGKKEEARAAVRHMKQTAYAKTHQVLSQASRAYLEGAHEMLVILQIGSDVKAVAVDGISSIKNLDDLCDLPSNLKNGNQYVECIAKEKMENGETDIIQMIDVFAL